MTIESLSWCCAFFLSPQFLMKNHQKYRSHETLVLIFTAFLTSLPFVPLIYFFSFSCCKAKESHLADLDTLTVDRNFQISPLEREATMLRYQVSELHGEAAVRIILNVHDFSVVGQDEKLTASEISGEKTF